MKIKSMKYNFAMSAIRTFMSIIFPLITFPYASRVLLSEGIGQANYVASITSYFQILAAFGISTYAITEGSKLRDDKKKLSHFATEIFSINIISTVLSYMIFLIVIVLPTFDNYRSLLLISSLTIIFSTISIEWLYFIVEEYRYITIRSILFQLLSLVLLFFLVRKHSDVSQYVALTAISAGGSGILNFIHARKHITLFINPIKTYNLKKHIKPILILFGISVTSTIYLNVDTTMLGLMKGDTTVGIYTTAVKINRILIMLISTLSTVLLPRLSYYIASDNKMEFNLLVKKTVQFMLMLIIPSMIGLYLLSEEIILIFTGRHFIDAVPVLKIMSVNLFLAPINGFITYQIFMPFRKEKAAFYAALSGSILNIALNSFLIPLYSLEGAAFATNFSEVIVMFICLYYANKLVNIMQIIKGSWQYLVTSIPIIGVNYLVEWLGVTNIYSKTALVTVLGAIIYGIGLLIVKNDLLMNLLNQVRFKFKMKST